MVSSFLCFSYLKVVLSDGKSDTTWPDLVQKRVARPDLAHNIKVNRVFQNITIMIRIIMNKMDTDEVYELGEVEPSGHHFRLK